MATLIPLTNPAPKNGKTGMCGQMQTMVYPCDHLDPDLAGKAKGMVAVVKEQVSVYNQLIKEVGSEKKVVGKCGQCWKSAAKKDAEHHIALAEMAGQEDTLMMLFWMKPLQWWRNL